jgi:hypothetical protein
MTPLFGKEAVEQDGAEASAWKPCFCREFAGWHLFPLTRRTSIRIDPRAIYRTMPVCQEQKEN